VGWGERASKGERYARVPEQQARRRHERQTRLRGREREKATPEG
jgi:hypothetical protein